MTAPVVVAQLRKDQRERLRVALDEYQGHQLIDLRITTQLTEGTDLWTPTKKGVCVNVSLLPELVRALQAAEVKARDLGLIGGGA